MAQYDRNLTLPDFFFKSLVDCYPLSDSQYLCHELSDLDYLKLGVERCISSARSGHGFLQTYRKDDGTRVSVSHFFESLKSKRRLANLSSVNQLMRPYLTDQNGDTLAEIEEFKNWHLYAADGHYHKAAIFDPKTKADHSEKDPSKSPTGHFFALDLRQHHLGYLDLAQAQDGKKSEHDITVLKRQELETLRQGARNLKKAFTFALLKKATVLPT